MSIRTTVSLEEDVLESLKEESRKRGESFRETLNNLLRFALLASRRQASETPFQLRPFHEMGQIPGLNYDRVNELLDYAEGEDRRW